MPCKICVSLRNLQPVCGKQDNGAPAFKNLKRQAACSLFSLSLYLSYARLISIRRFLSSQMCVKKPSRVCVHFFFWRGAREQPDNKTYIKLLLGWRAWVSRVLNAESCTFGAWAHLRADSHRSSRGHYLLSLCEGRRLNCESAGSCYQIICKWANRTALGCIRKRERAQKAQTPSLAEENGSIEFHAAQLQFLD